MGRRARRVHLTVAVVAALALARPYPVPRSRGGLRPAPTASPAPPDARLGHQAKVAQYLYNCPEYLESFFACCKAAPSR